MLQVIGHFRAQTLKASSPIICLLVKIMELLFGEVAAKSPAHTTDLRQLLSPQHGFWTVQDSKKPGTQLLSLA